MKIVIPQYFNHTTVDSFHKSSFRSMLYDWGFEKLKGGPDTGCYYHEHFHRDFPHLITNIRSRWSKVPNVSVNNNMPLDSKKSLSKGDQLLKVTSITEGESTNACTREIFPTRLHEILSNKEYSHIIAWKVS